MPLRPNPLSVAAAFLTQAESQREGWWELLRDPLGSDYITLQRPGRQPGDPPWRLTIRATRRAGPYTDILAWLWRGLDMAGRAEWRCSWRRRPDRTSGSVARALREILLPSHPYYAEEAGETDD